MSMGPVPATEKKKKGQGNKTKVKPDEDTKERLTVWRKENCRLGPRSLSPAAL